MTPAKVVWRLRIPELLGLPSFGLDDVAVDKLGNVFVSDSTNRSVYKLSSTSVPVDSYSVGSSCVAGEDGNFLKLTVHPDSSFCVADLIGGCVVKYAQDGAPCGEYWTPGILALCGGPRDTTCVLSDINGMCRIDIYNAQGEIIDVLPAPARQRTDVDPSLVSMATDAWGNVYVSHGMPPYMVWKVNADGSGADVIGRNIDYSEDAVLVSDIAVDSDSGVLWVLMACKEFGLQLLDSFSLQGEFLGTSGIPHSESLYSVLCAADDAAIYLLDSGTGPGSGELLRCSVLE